MIDYTTRAAKFQPFAANGFAPLPFTFRTKKPGARRRRWGEPLYVRLVVNGGYSRSPRIERGEGRYSRFARERRGARGEGSSRQIASLRRSPELPNVGASQLPLPTAKKDTRMGAFWWWEEVDSNYRSRRRQIYSLIHLAALESSHMKLERCSAIARGAGDWNRTHNLLITNQLLCQLSYTSMVGASGRNRTTDTGIFSPLLYRLSYRGILKPAWQPTYAIKQASSEKVATRNGLEPSTSSVTGWRSNQLNYRAVIRNNGGPSRTRTADQSVMSRPL